jgi:hypothetical protein
MKRCKNITGWTDYPVEALGDPSGVEAPIRRIKVISYDNDKYARVLVLGTTVELEVKAGYLYGKPIRCPSFDKVPKRYDQGYRINRRKLERMICK